MKRFWSYISNGEYSVGCTGQTVYLYNKNGDEIRKFKDVYYAYHPIFSPDGKILVVKSTDGRLAVYSLETLSLIKKIRFSKVDGCQDEGFCFSADGQFFINIELLKDEHHAAVSFYSSKDFTLVNQVLLGEKVMVEHIEADESTNKLYILGFVRDGEGVFDYGFVANFENSGITNITAIPKREYDFYCAYKRLQMMGFTKKAYEWTDIGCELDEMKSMDRSLAKLYMYYHK